MRTIAIMNNKGGVGKTVTAVNLADILVRDHGKRVVAVDCDGQMNLTRFYVPGFDPEVGLSVASILRREGESVWADNLLPIRPGLDLLPASQELYELDIKAVSGQLAGSGQLLDLAIAAAEDAEHDFMIFDCPPGFTAASFAALLAAEEVIIPVLADGFSIHGMTDLAAQIVSLRQANPRIRIAGVLINQWHNSPVVHEGESLLRSMDVPVFEQVIRRTDKVPESTFAREPLLEYSPTSAAGYDYRAWVRELLGGEEVLGRGQKV